MHTSFNSSISAWRGHKMPSYGVRYLLSFFHLLRINDHLQSKQFLLSLAIISVEIPWRKRLLTEYFGCGFEACGMSEEKSDMLWFSAYYNKKLNKRYLQHRSSWTPISPILHEDLLSVENFRPSFNDSTEKEHRTQLSQITRLTMRWEQFINRSYYSLQ